MDARAAAIAPVMLAVLASPAGAVERPRYNARYETSLARATPAGARATARLAVTGTDRTRGVPTFAFSPRGAAKAPATVSHQPGPVAKHFLRERRELYGLTAAAVDAAKVHRVHDRGRGGVVVVLRQTIDGVEVFQNDAKVLLDRQLDLVAIGGNLRAEADGSTGLARGHFLLSEREAIARAFTDLYGVGMAPQSLVNEQRAEGGYLELDLLPEGAVRAADLTFHAPARVKKVWFPLAGTLVPAHYVELQSGKIDEARTDGYAYVVAADDGRLLYRQSLTHAVAFDYRVFADTTAEARPLDGPIADFTPHPTGNPDGSFPAYVSPVLVSMESFNAPTEGGPDPWLSEGATETKGNNVDAYTDDGAPQGFSAGDLRATTTGPGVFDRVYDTSLDPVTSDDQRMAAVTQLFYVNNWLHDWWYDSGFDEAAGNAQADNYGRGGAQGDPLLAEAQDGAFIGNLNNANMFTPADGSSPRMQMFLWSGGADLTLAAGAPLNQGYPTQGAGFGPTNFDVTADLMLVDDGSGSLTDACETITNDLNGKIALMDRGTCTFQSKVARAEAAGAVGAVIVNNQANAGPMFMGGGQGSQPTIGALSISLENGNVLKGALLDGPVAMTLQREEGVRPDGTIDNLIVAHEWGHYMHNRLVFCNSVQCRGEGEGWADFLSMMMAVRDAEDWAGSYAAAIYAPQNGYFGIRRAPYSVDPDVNAFTFRHIQNGEPLPGGFPQSPSGAPNAEVHRTGEIWASMLWEAYYRLLERTQGPSPAYDFAEAQRRMADYIVTGMTLAPADPTFTEQRDALIAAASARDTDDMIAIAEGFAARGAGSCAGSPPRNAEDNKGVTENYLVGGSLTIESIRLDDSVSECDGDGNLDAGERGMLVIEVENRGPFELDAGTITLSTTTSGITLGDEEIAVSALGPYSVTTVSTEVALSPDGTDAEGLELQLEVEAPSACNPSYTRLEAFRIDYDNVAEAATSTDFESDTVVMFPVGAEKDAIWGREDYDLFDRVWRGVDTSHITDSYLETPFIEVSETEDLVLTLRHRHRFEVSDDTYWDGGVIEVKRETDIAWEDVATYDDPGYVGQLSDLADNPLSDRMAFAGDNPSWPQTDVVTVDFGDAFAGDKVKLRFRIGTDQAVGDFGWELHEIGLLGITNEPFPTVIADETACGLGLLADAGDDRQVTPGQAVVLDGSGSNDPEGDPLSFVWTQVDGPEVTLEDADSVAPKLVAPEEETSVTFELTVSDGQGEATDQVTLTVVASDDAAVEPLIVGGGCGCTIPGDPPSPEHPRGHLLALLAGVALIRRRR